MKLEEKVLQQLQEDLKKCTGPALFVGVWALQQLWLFWVAPIIGALLAGATYRWLWGHQEG